MTPLKDKSSRLAPTTSSAYPSATVFTNTNTSQFSQELIQASNDPAHDGNIFKAKFYRYLEKAEDEDTTQHQGIQTKINDEILKRFQLK